MRTTRHEEKKTKTTVKTMLASRLDLTPLGSCGSLWQSYHCCSLLVVVSPFDDPLQCLVDVVDVLARDGLVGDVPVLDCIEI